MDTINIIKLILAMMSVESGMNTNAYSEREEAAGALQIRPIMVHDVNRIAGYRKYSPSDRYDLEQSIHIALDYWNHYCTEDRLGEPVTAEILARCWNAGYEGMKRGNGSEYWEKVRAIYEAN